MQAMLEVNPFQDVLICYWNRNQPKTFPEEMESWLGKKLCFPFHGFWACIT